MKFKWNVKSGEVQFENGKSIQLQANTVGQSQAVTQTNMLPNKEDREEKE